MSKAENKYAELIEKHEFTGSSKKKEDDSRCSPDRARSPQGFTPSSRTETKESHLARKEAPW
jgi:hypothetical protein